MPTDDLKNPENQEKGADCTAGVDGTDLAGSPWAEAEGAADRAGMTKGPGRPKGALNRKTKDFEAYYTAKGYKDPLIALGEFVTANPLDLWAWFNEQRVEQIAAYQAQFNSLPKDPQSVFPIPDLFQIIREQHDCAKELAPYLHGKKPTVVEITDERLPTLALFLGMDQTSFTEKLASEGALSLGQAIEGDPNEINDLDGQDT